MTEYGHSDHHRIEKHIDEVREKHKNSNQIQKRKLKIRHSRQWRALKERLIASRGPIDEVTGQKIKNIEKVTCHHMRLNPKKYSDFSRDSDFMILSDMTHSVVHWLWEHTHGVDFSILNKLEDVLKKMREYLEEDEVETYENSGTGPVSDSLRRSNSELG